MMRLGEVFSFLHNQNSTDNKFTMEGVSGIIYIDSSHDANVEKFTQNFVIYSSRNSNKNNFLFVCYLYDGYVFLFTEE